MIGFSIIGYFEIKGLVFWLLFGISYEFCHIAILSQLGQLTEVKLKLDRRSEGLQIPSILEMTGISHSPEPIGDFARNHFGFLL